MSFTCLQIFHLEMCWNVKYLTSRWVQLAYVLVELYLLKVLISQRNRNRPELLIIVRDF